MHRAPASCPVLFAVLFALPLGALATARAAPPVLDPSGLPLTPATTSATLEPTAGVPLAPASSSDGSWFRVPTVIQPVIGARQEHSMVYDPVRQRFLAFGGHPHFAPGWFNDVWERPLGGTGEWTPLTVTGSLPPARRGHSAVYDPVRDRMLVYAGDGQTGT